ncbi:hypothetical protein LX32DRAFT_412388 [Colletotrichum zoysiae]|uniref:Uncharacterized protein n=1 Tax=Colletotrichum zoysiae TaxID=1216348 RepID=A0AAD9M119_9PEZI|nr:hypothetical protein LX32DRAFT_412388 [Colletotrichum zoysiae]
MTRCVLVTSWSPHFALIARLSSRIDMTGRPILCPRLDHSETCPMRRSSIAAVRSTPCHLVPSMAWHVGPNKPPLSHPLCSLAPGRTAHTSRYHCGLLRTAYSSAAVSQRSIVVIQESLQTIHLHPYTCWSRFPHHLPSLSLAYTHTTTYIRNLTDASSTLDSPCPAQRHWSSALPAHHAGDGPQTEMPLHHDPSLAVVGRRFVAPHGLSRGRGGDGWTRRPVRANSFSRPERPAPCKVDLSFALGSSRVRRYN